MSAVFRNPLHKQRGWFHVRHEEIHMVNRSYHILVAMHDEHWAIHVFNEFEIRKEILSMEIH